MAAGSAPAAAAPPSLPPLHAVPDARAGGRIVDAEGRTVLLRGVNVNALGEYWSGTRFPPVFPLGRDDPRRMAAVGWNVVRLIVSWSRVEPRPGRYDERYLDLVAAAVARFGREGIYTIVDMHQDAWGPTVAARPGERCTGTTVPSVGWDGAPGWATFDAGEPHCTPGTRELDPAVMAAWRAFFADRRGPGGVGIQQRFVRMWGHVARRFARERAVAGFDLLNEPNVFGAEEKMALLRMYAHAVAAVRAGERAVRGGRRHLVLFEPSVLWSAIGSGPPARFSRDRDLVYSPHLYTGGFTGGPITREAFATAAAEARGLGGVPVLTGEWGGDPGRAGPRGDGYFRSHQARQDEFRIGATLWLWRESCGDPHRINDLRLGAKHQSWGEFAVDCRTNRVTGERRTLIRDLTRAYVRAAPGRLASQSYRPASGCFRASGVASPGAGDLVAFYPPTGGRGIRVVVRGLARARVERARGGGRLVEATPRGRPWSIAITPQAGQSQRSSSTRSAAVGAGGGG